MGIIDAFVCDDSDFGSGLSSNLVPLHRRRRLFYEAQRVLWSLQILF